MAAVCRTGGFSTRILIIKNTNLGVTYIDVTYILEQLITGYMRFCCCTDANLVTACVAGRLAISGESWLQFPNDSNGHLSDCVSLILIITCRYHLWHTK